MKAARMWRLWQSSVNGLISLRGVLAPSKAVFALAIVFTAVGCGQTAKPVTPASAGKVYSYFGGPFAVAGITSGNLFQAVATFDHAANQVGVSGFVVNQNSQVPTGVLNGSFTAANTGFLSITENFATNGSGIMTAQNPPLTGAWAVEIQGAGALANLLNVNNAPGGAVTVSAAPTAMADNTACPDFPAAKSFLYVTVPNAGQKKDAADYGATSISTQGSDVNFTTQPFLVGTAAQPGITVAGACSDTNLGALTAYPLNSFAAPSNLDLVSIGASGLMVSSFSSGASSSSLGAFGGATGVLGVARPASPVDPHAIVGAQYNGFVFAPRNTASAPPNSPSRNYDITMLASAFGDHPAGSQACSVLQNSLAANNGQGANTVAALPSANSLYGGEFLTTTSAGAVNDPTGASGSENCDVVIDLGTQDPANNGLFPNATIFIGSNFPPFSSTQQWNCSGAICAVSFPAAAIVGTVQGQNVIFMAASAVSNPAAQLPDGSGARLPQPVAIYLFQKAH